MNKFQLWIVVILVLFFLNIDNFLGELNYINEKIVKYDTNFLLSENICGNLGTQLQKTLKRFLL